MCIRNVASKNTWRTKCGAHFGEGTSKDYLLDASYRNSMREMYENDTDKKECF